LKDFERVLFNLLMSSEYLLFEFLEEIQPVLGLSDPLCEE
jgi:hypothetical protein